MNKTKQSFADYYIDLSIDYIGLLCAMGSHYDFEIDFTWSHSRGFDVNARNRVLKANGANLWKAQIGQANQDLDVWTDFVENAERKAYELYGQRADEMISAKLSAAYIYMSAVKSLRRKQIKELKFLGVEHRNNQLHYIFETGKKEVDVQFIGAKMDNFLTRIENESKQSGANEFYVTKN